MSSEESKAYCGIAEEVSRDDLSQYVEQINILRAAQAKSMALDASRAAQQNAMLQSQLATVNAIQAGIPGSQGNMAMGASPFWGSLGNGGAGGSALGGVASATQQAALSCRMCGKLTFTFRPSQMCKGCADDASFGEVIDEALAEHNIIEVALAACAVRK